MKCFSSDIFITVNFRSNISSCIRGSSICRYKFSSTCRRSGPSEHTQPRQSRSRLPFSHHQHNYGRGAANNCCSGAPCNSRPICKLDRHPSVLQRRRCAIPYIIKVQEYFGDVYLLIQRYITDISWGA